MRNYNACPKCTIFAARCYASAAYAIMRCVCVSGCVWLCVSVTFVHSVKTNKHTFKIFFTIHTILVFPYRTAWQITPNEDVQCMWGRQKSRLWANIWLHWVLWSVPAASAIHLAATNHAEFITLFAGKRPSLLIVGNSDEVYDKKPQRYAEDNVAQW